MSNKPIDIIDLDNEVDILGRKQGHKCKCGKEIKWPLYVFTHCHYEILFTCPDCKTKAIIHNLEVVDYDYRE